ncbi:MAG: GNAT family N-acetyltransferase [Lachnospiraceae bacterium]|nr:GNAT family N-acetyltransferase [Lachnospiraceae bacterium]
MSEKFISERLQLEALSLTQMKQLAADEQNILKESVLSETVQLAIMHKIEQMCAVSEDVHPWLTYWLIKKHGKAKGIGVIGSKFLPDEEGYVEIGYAIAGEEQGNGYMTEALEVFLDWLYEFPFCTGARLSIHNDNKPSIQVAKKCGFWYKEQKEAYRIYQYDF